MEENDLSRDNSINDNNLLEKVAQVFKKFEERLNESDGEVLALSTEYLALFSLLAKHLSVVLPLFHQNTIIRDVMQYFLAKSGYIVENLNDNHFTLRPKLDDVPTWLSDPAFGDLMECYEEFPINDHTNAIFKNCDVVRPDVLENEPNANVLGFNGTTIETDNVDMSDESSEMRNSFEQADESVPNSSVVEPCGTNCVIVDASESDAVQISSCSSTTTACDDEISCLYMGKRSVESVKPIPHDESYCKTSTRTRSRPKKRPLEDNTASICTSVAKKRTYYCVECDKTYLTEIDFTSHNCSSKDLPDCIVYVMHESGIPSLYCVRCVAVIPAVADKWNLWNHIGGRRHKRSLRRVFTDLRESPEQSIDDRSVVPLDDGTKYCIICDVSILAVSDVNAHILGVQHQNLLAAEWEENQKSLNARKKRLEKMEKKQIEFISCKSENIVSVADSTLCLEAEVESVTESTNLLPANVAPEGNSPDEMNVITLTVSTSRSVVPSVIVEVSNCPTEVSDPLQTQEIMSEPQSLVTSNLESSGNVEESSSQSRNSRAALEPNIPEESVTFLCEENLSDGPNKFPKIKIETLDDDNKLGFICAYCHVSFSTEAALDAHLSEKKIITPERNASVLPHGLIYRWTDRGSVSVYCFLCHTSVNKRNQKNHMSGALHKYSANWPTTAGYGERFDYSLVSCSDGRRYCVTCERFLPRKACHMYHTRREDHQVLLSQRKNFGYVRSKTKLYITEKDGSKFCNLCEQSLQNEFDFEVHLHRLGHLQKLDEAWKAAIENLRQNLVVGQPLDDTVFKKKGLSGHVNSITHKKNMQKFIKNSENSNSADSTTGVEKLIVDLGADFVWCLACNKEVSTILRYKVPKNRIGFVKKGEVKCE